VAKTETAKRTTTRTRAPARKPDPPVAELDHAEGCPADRERQEAYRDVTPDGTRVIVSRCLDCPAHRVDEE
jgi:hypothetical protein